MMGKGGEEKGGKKQRENKTARTTKQQQLQQQAHVSCRASCMQSVNPNPIPFIPSRVSSFPS
jgi:hypothetical protein